MSEALHFAGWLVACVVLVTSCSARPAVVLAVVVGLRVLVPSTAGGLLIGDWDGNGAVHPATLLLAVHCLLGLHGRTRVIAAELRGRHGTYTALFVVGFLSVVQSVVGTGVTSVLGLTNAVLAPMVFFLVLLVHEREAPGVLRGVASVTVVVVALVSALVVVQAAFHTGFPWSFRTGAGSPSTGVGFRPTGTFDSPLDLGYVVAVTIPMTTVLTRLPLRCAAAALMVTAVVLSASRAPTVVAVVGATWVFVTAMRSLVGVVTVAVVGAVVLAAVVGTPLLDGLLDRVNGNDGNSASERAAANRFIVEHLSAQWLSGGGWGHAWSFTGSALRTSLEDSYAILAFDLGIVPVAVLLLAEARIMLSRRGLPGFRLGAACGVVLGFSYSGLATMSAASLVLWLALATCSLHRPPAGRSRTPDSSVGTRRRLASETPPNPAASRPSGGPSRGRHRRAVPPSGGHRPICEYPVHRAVPRSVTTEARSSADRR